MFFHVFLVPHALYINSPYRDKLSPSSLKCVFAGYYRSQKRIYKEELS